MKPLYLLLLSSIILDVSCKSNTTDDPNVPTEKCYDNISFPKQTDIKTFIVGEGMRTTINASIVGTQRNNVKRLVKYKVKDDLVTSSTLSIMKMTSGYVRNAVMNKEDIKILPNDVYKIDDNVEITIPVSELTGKISLSVDSTKFLSSQYNGKSLYVLPFYLESSNAGTITPSKRSCIIGFKYENTLFGSYYQGGKITTTDANGNALKEANYATNNKRMCELKTVSPFQLSLVPSSGNNSVPVNLTLNSDKSITVSTPESASITVEKEGNSSYNGASKLEDRKIFLSYKYNNADGTVNHVLDTLTFKSRIHDGVQEPATVVEKEEVTNLLFNNSFSDQKEINIWTKSGVSGTQNISFFEKGQNDYGMVSIESQDKAALYVKYKLKNLSQNKLYRFSGKIKTENVKDGRGAVLYMAMGSIYDQPWNASKFIYGTNDWQDVYVDFRPNNNGEAEICCGLGYPGNTSNGGKASGKAWFEKLTVKEVTDDEMYMRESKHFILCIKKEAQIKDADTDKALANWDKMYEAYSDFVGGTPYDGKKIFILTTPGIESGYWALAGNPILWNAKSCSANLIQNCADDKDWGFGVIHEIGHTFNIKNTSWDWDDELFANFRMSYGLYANNGKAQGCVGDMTTFYKKAYDSTIAQGKTAPGKGDVIHYTYLRIAKKYGWDIFKKTIIELNTMSSSSFSGMSKWDKIVKFWSVLSKYAGEDVTKTTYTQEEYDLLKKSYN